MYIKYIYVMYQFYYINLYISINTFIYLCLCFMYKLCIYVHIFYGWTFDARRWTSSSLSISYDKYTTGNGPLEPLWYAHTLTHSHTLVDSLSPCRGCQNISCAYQCIYIISFSIIIIIASIIYNTHAQLQTQTRIEYEKINWKNCQHQNKCLYVSMRIDSDLILCCKIFE